jgi:hypothetical protein
LHGEKVSLLKAIQESPFYRRITPGQSVDCGDRALRVCRLCNVELETGGDGALALRGANRPSQAEIPRTIVFSNLLQTGRQAARRCAAPAALSSAAHPLSAPAGLAAVDESVKEQLRRQFVTLDPVALLKAIRDTQEELSTVGDGGDQPPTRASEDLGAFLDGLAAAWQKPDG